MAVSQSELKQSFDAIGVDWAFMREPETVAHDCVYGKDVDIWSAAEEPRMAARVLSPQGWLLVGGRTVGREGSERHAVSLRFERGTGAERLPRLEVFLGALRFRGVIYLDRSKVLPCIRRIGEFPYLAGEALLLILITRSALRGNLYGERLDRARRAWDAATEAERLGWYQHSQHLVGARAAQRLRRVVEGHRDDAGTGRAYRFLAHLKHPSEIPELARGVLRRRLRPPRGFTCYVIGTDGAGKSTLSERLVDELARRGIQAQQRYWGRGRGNLAWIDEVRRLAFAGLGRVGIEAQPRRRTADGSLRHDPSRVPQGVALYRAAVVAGALIYFLEYWWRYRFVVVPELRRGGSVVLDRGPFDLAVMKGLPAILKRLVRLAPQPNLLVFCDTSPETIFARKPERTLDDIRVQQGEYRRLYARASQRLLSARVDAAMSVESNVARLVVLASAARAASNGALDWDLLDTVKEAEV